MLGCYVAILIVAIYVEAFEPIKDQMQEQLYYHCLTLYALYIGIFSNRFLAHASIRTILYALFEITIYLQYSLTKNDAYCVTFALRVLSTVVIAETVIF